MSLTLSELKLRYDQSGTGLFDCPDLRYPAQPVPFLVHLPHPLPPVPLQFLVQHALPALPLQFLFH